MDLEVSEANLSDPADAAAVLELIDAYAIDPKGHGRPLLEAPARDRVQKGTRGFPGNAGAAGEAPEQTGRGGDLLPRLLDLRARPLLHIHDIAVLPEAGGRAVGRALLEVVEAEASRRDCCRVTLVVRGDNRVAQRLCRAMGFGPGEVPWCSGASRLGSVAPVLAENDPRPRGLNLLALAVMLRLSH